MCRPVFLSVFFPALMSVVSSFVQLTPNHVSRFAGFDGGPVGDLSDFAGGGVCLAMLLLYRLSGTASGDHNCECQEP